MSDVCFVCGRRANRKCPASPVLALVPEAMTDSGALLRPICSQCCGKGRRRTIDCPSSCPHVLAAVETAFVKLLKLSQDPEMELRHGEVLHNLRVGLSRVRHDQLPDLRDHEAREAFANAADTMRVRSSGLIYEFRSPDPRVQMLSHELAVVAALHERGANGMVKTDGAALIQCLEYLRRQAAACERAGRGDAYFVELTVQCVGGIFLTRDSEGLVGRLTEENDGAWTLDLTAKNGDRLDSEEQGHALFPPADSTPLPGSPIIPP